MITQFAIILMVTYLGEIISKLIEVPIPGPIIGMLIFLILLERKIIKLDQVEKASKLLLLYLPLFFIPPGVKLMSALDLLNGNILKIFLLMVITTALTMGMTGLTVQYLINRRRK